MRKAADIAAEQQTLRTIVTLTSAFEGISSMKIAKIKDQVLQSQTFFTDLWHMYSRLRVSQSFNYGRTSAEAVSEKELFVVVTAEGGFSGDIDQRLIGWMLKSYDKNKNDILVIGHHGVLQLAQLGISYIKYFKLPGKDENINVGPLIRYVQAYKKTTVFYQTYVSLMVQDIKKIELHSAVQQEGSQVEEDDEIINEKNYIFEPSTEAVVAHLERTMLQIALSRTILESKLAQYASRFRAMSAANDSAEESYAGLNTEYRRVRRATADQRLKEITTSLKLARSNA